MPPTRRLITTLLVALLAAGSLGSSSTASPAAGVNRFDEAWVMWITAKPRYTAYFVRVHRLILASQNRIKTKLEFFKAPCQQFHQDLFCSVSRVVKRDIDPKDFLMYPTVHGARLTFMQGGEERVITWSGDLEEPTGHSYAFGTNGGWAVLWQWNWPDATAEGSLYDRRFKPGDTRRASLMALTTAYAFASPPSSAPRSVPWRDGRVILRHTER